MKQYDLFGQEISKDQLKDKFGIIPFSILDTKSAEWKNRKKKWLSKGIKGELGRDADLLGFGRIYSKGNERLIDRKTSIFDPVICEVIYDWFCVKGGTILDPFAGGSVRGIVANYKGFDYVGIELREEQYKANFQQSIDILGEDKLNSLNWILGDSNVILDDIKDSFDLIFTCPPYFDLEKYSDLDSDLSNMSFDNFLINFKSILHKCERKLKNNRFFCILIGDVRDKERTINWYRNLVGITKQILIESGLHLYNEIIIAENIGTSAMRVEQAFLKRKVVKIHQNLLIFYKGQNVNDIRDEFN